MHAGSHKLSRGCGIRAASASTSAPPQAPPRVRRFGPFSESLEELFMVVALGAGSRAAKYPPGLTPSGIFTWHHSSSPLASVCRKTTVSPALIFSGTCTISAGGGTSKVSPGLRPSGTLTHTSTPSGLWKISSEPSLAPFGTPSRNSAGGASRSRCSEPGSAPGGASTRTLPWGPSACTCCPGWKSLGIRTGTVTGGVTSASVLPLVPFLQYLDSAMNRLQPRSSTLLGRNRLLSYCAFLALSTARMAFSRRSSAVPERRWQHKSRESCTRNISAGVPSSHARIV
mmetsp:Transcript_110935/g.324502  ORF Transcript_110935/g.324502 Transcript_110935/m.324502 type:complete len:285 (+) Transcript_110935:114-968(+)